MVSKLNRYRHEYYNLAKPSASDAVYDRLFDELAALERKTGIVLSNSPTQTVGYAPVSALRKVTHPIPLLSMDKTKQVDDLVSMGDLVSMIRTGIENFMNMLRGDDSTPISFQRFLDHTGLFFDYYILAVSAGAIL